MENSNTILIQIIAGLLILIIMIVFARIMIFSKKPKAKSLCVGSDGGACRFCETCIIVEQAKKEFAQKTQKQENILREADEYFSTKTIPSQTIKPSNESDQMNQRKKEA